MSVGVSMRLMDGDACCIYADDRLQWEKKKKMMMMMKEKKK